jgi:hypothetical protein
VEKTVGKGKLENLKPFQPGQSGNPGGRPKRKPITEAYLKLMDEVIPNHPQRRTFAEAIALGQAKAAMRGSAPAAREIADRLEGKAPQAIELSGGAITVQLDDVTPAENEKRIAELLLKAAGIKKENTK